MKNIRELILALLAMGGIFASSAQGREQNQFLRDYCENKMGGQFITEYTCPNSGVVRKEDFCRFYNADHQLLHFNGCNGDDQDGYRVYFFKACLMHDFCYHSEPQVSGKSKADCDLKFKADMLEICKRDDRNGNKYFMCKSMAKAYYEAVSLKGKESWRCTKDSVRYPKSMDELP